MPVIADIHFNHTLALKAINAGADCIRLNLGNIGGREKVAEVAKRATAAGTRRCGSESTRGRYRSTCTSWRSRIRSRRWSVPGLEFVELMEDLNFENFKVSVKSTNVPRTIAANKRLARGDRILIRFTWGSPRAGTKWSGSLRSSVGLGTLLADGVGTHDPNFVVDLPGRGGGQGRLGDIEGALELRQKGPVLFACPTCGRLQFDMDTVVAEIETRLERFTTHHIEVAVLGCAVNGIGEASHADFGITGARE